jgi:Glycosyl hydrolase family 53
MSRTRAFRAVLAACMLLAPAAHAADRKVPRGFFGSVWAGEIENAPLDVQTAAWDRLARAGVESTRVVFNWEVANSVKDGVIDWSRTDNAVAHATERGIQVLPTVMYAPNWAKRYPGIASSPPKHNSDYTDFLKKLIARYGPNGEFWKVQAHVYGVPYRPLRVWQIWNEVDLQFQWYRKADHWRKSDAKDYGKLLKASYKTIHQADPGAKVMLASLAIDSWRILGKLYKNADIHGNFDIAALQAEAGDPHFLPTVLKRFRAVLDKHHDGKVPMWATEFGWPASKGRTPKLTYATGYMTGYATTDKGMAKRLKIGYPLLADTGFRKRMKLKHVFWFTSVSSYEGDFEYDYSGLLRLHGNSLSTKPAYGAYAQVAKRYEGCAKNSDGDCK